MQKFVLFTLIAAVALAACAPSGSASAEATLIALSVELTVAAQTQAPTAAEVTPSPTLQPTVAPTLAPTEAPTATETTEPAEPAAEEPFEVPDWPLFRQGDEGPEVYAIQHLLRSHGYDLTADGIFGPQTRTEVRNFQIAKGLGADGIVGPNTWAALIQGKQLDQGDTGQAVRALQRLLHDKFGYANVNIDADFGPITDNAVRDFQAEYDLDVDGIVGPDTWQALIAIEP
jgi:peptidoglycan hydrolase-like protein with peptidoglycan-binding domain